MKKEFLARLGLDKEIIRKIQAENGKYIELEKAKVEAAAKTLTLERTAQVKDFTSGKKFVNEITRDAINYRLAEELGKKAKANPSRIFLRHSLKVEKNVIVDENAPQPPTVTKMAGHDDVSIHAPEWGATLCFAS